VKPIHALLATVILCPSAAHAASCTAIAAVPTTISAPGNYCLVQNYTVNQGAGAAISIASNDVSLDCDGHSIRNLSTFNNGSSTGIYAYGQNNITVKNCRITGGFTNGIDISQSNTIANKAYYNTIENNYVAGPLLHGIRAYGSVIEVSNNRVYDIGGQLNNYAVGIRLGGSTAAGAFRMHIVRNNYVVGTRSPYSAAYGIFSDGSLASAYIDNGVAGTAGAAGKLIYGMYVIGTYNRLTDNHVTGTGVSNEIGIFSTDATSTCFDNYLRTTVATKNCNAALGNY
jgi:hypothetical protein